MVDAVILPLTVAVLTTAWLERWLRYLVDVAAAGEAAPLPSYLVLVALAAGGAYLTRRALASKMPLPEARRLVLWAGGAAILAAQWLTYPLRFPLGYLSDLLDWGQFISPEFIVLMGCAFLWWRGVLIGRTRIPFDELESAFNLGLLALAGLFILNHLYPRLAPAEVVPAMLVFFGAGLGALALSSFERSRRHQKEATGAWLSLNRYWLATVAGVIGMILVGGLGVMGMLNPQALARLAEWLRPAVDWLAPYVEIVMTLLATVIIAVTTPLFLALMRVLSMILTAFRLPQLPQPPEAEAASDELLQGLLNSPAFKLTTRGTTALLLLGLFALLVVVALRRFRLLPETESDETRENILSRELLARQLRDLLARRRGPQAERQPAYLPLDGEPGDPRLIIRRAYQGMLEWARARYPPRSPGQTPYHYAGLLARLAPPAGKALERLTRAYVRARYAAETPPMEDAHDAQNALQELENLASQEAPSQKGAP